MLISDLIPVLAQKYFELTGQFPNKTKLIKMAYLSEVYFMRYNGKRLTDQKWIFWKFGPYFFEYESILENRSVFELPDKENDFFPVIISPEFEPKEISVEESGALLRALDHANEELNDILDYVYFETEPMVKAEHRGEELDFDSVFPREYYIVNEYSVNYQQGKEILKKVREWKRNNHYAE